MYIDLQISILQLTTWLVFFTFHVTPSLWPFVIDFYLVLPDEDYDKNIIWWRQCSALQNIMVISLIVGRKQKAWFCELVELLLFFFYPQLCLKTLTTVSFSSLQKLLYVILCEIKNSPATVQARPIAPFSFSRESPTYKEMWEI